MNRLRGLIAAPILALALIAVPTAAHAGGSDSPTPYAVTSAGITLPEGDTFPAHGHVNLTTSQGGKGLHFDPNNGHPGGAWIGQSFIPWSAFGLTTCDTVSWVQIHGYNEHYGEGGQPAVTVGDCAEEPPAEEPEVVPNALYLSHSVTCGRVEITLRNVSPWIYPVSVKIDGVHSYGPTVDNRTGGKLNGPQKDQSATRVIEFAEDSGTHTVEYRIDAGSERDLYVGTPLNEWTTLVVESDCEPNIPPKPKAKKGIDFRADAICTAEPATGDLVTTLEKRAWTRDWVLVDNAWELGEKVYGDWEVVESAGVPWPKCQPDPLTGVEVRDGGPICVEPLDGTATAATETRTWTQTASWNWKKGWVYGEVVYGDWEVETVTVEAEACAPPPADEPPAPPLEAERLATTGTEGILEGMLAAVAILLAGAGVIFGRIIWDRRAERRSRE